MSSSGPKGVVRRKVTRSADAGESSGPSVGSMIRVSGDSTCHKMSPTAVMVTSISFIVVVLVLHIIGKITGSTGVHGEM